MGMMRKRISTPWEPAPKDYFDLRTKYEKLQKAMTESGNPDPRNFKIRWVKNHGHLWATMIEYPDCLNFEGRKILITTRNISSDEIIDPHFVGTDGFIVARFVPNNWGISAAEAFLKNWGDNPMGIGA